MNWYLKVMRNYAVFSGRAQRAEFWFFLLISLAASFLLLYADAIMGTYDMKMKIGLLFTLYSLVVFIPTIAVSVRRLHDIGKSGWWLLLFFFPVVGQVVLIVFFLLDSQIRPNAYGPNPKALLRFA